MIILDRKNTNSSIMQFICIGQFREPLKQKVSSESQLKVCKVMVETWNVWKKQKIAEIKFLLRVDIYKGWIKSSGNSSIVLKLLYYLR